MGQSGFTQISLSLWIVSWHCLFTGRLPGKKFLTNNLLWSQCQALLLSCHLTFSLKRKSIRIGYLSCLLISNSIRTQVLNLTNSGRLILGTKIAKDEGKASEKLRTNYHFSSLQPWRLKRKKSHPISHCLWSYNSQMRKIYRNRKKFMQWQGLR